EALQLEAAFGRPCPQHAERPWQERPLTAAAAPPRRRRQHVELAGAGSRAAAVRAAEHDVGAVTLAREDGGVPPAEGSGRRSAHGTSVGRRAWMSCKARTGNAPRRAAAIARAAAIPPAIVVMHGIDRATAALRIS